MICKRLEKELYAKNEAESLNFKGHRSPFHTTEANVKR